MVGAVAAAVIALPLTLISAPAPVMAADGFNFDPGYIISDEIFYHENAMSANDVQEFLNSEGGGIRNYTQDTPVIGADQYCKGLNGGLDSAATIIWEVAQSCGINPQVILVLLQKEQSLITLANPSQGRYNSATGYSCPDTAPCDPAFQGFVYQVYYAARAFNRYAANPASYGYRAGATHNILYNPNPNCGYRSIYVRNQATANLYIYTPYTPNASALANLYGEGDGCASYGNRNFWRLFTDWFGSTVSNTSSADARSLTFSLYADVLGREPDPGGLNTWPGYILYSGWTPGQVASAILSSEEYYTQRITDAYRTILVRDPDPVGAADWLNRMLTNRVSVDEIASHFTRSQEYYNQASGDPSEFVRILYRSMLNREAGGAEVAYWAPIVQSSGSGFVAQAIYQTYESGVIRVNRVYELYLKRGVDPSGVSSWVPLVLAQGDQAVRSAVVGSLEYYLAAKARFPQS
jgi:hypothetical protein